MSSKSTSTNVGAAAGAVEGAGGISVSPALTAGEDASSSAASASASVSLFIGLPPFLRINEPDSIQAPASDPQSLFAHFWKLRTAGDPARTLSFCDVILELIPPSDADAQVRHANARAIVLRDLCDYRGAYRTHLTARPFLPSAAGTYVGDHYHGLGVTLMRLGEHVRAYKCFESARGFHVGEPDKLARTDITAAMLLVLMNKPREAHAILDGVAVEALRPDVAMVRAQAYEVEGDLSSARRAIASALYMLADSENVAARDEARKVLERIEGGAR